MQLYQLARKKKVTKKRRKTQPDFGEGLEMEEERTPGLTELQSSIGNYGMVKFVQTKVGLGKKNVQYYVNQNYTSNLFQRGGIRSQSKLKEDQVKLNKYEKQANRMVDRVMKMPAFERGETVHESDSNKQAKQVELSKARLSGLPDILYDPFFGKAFRLFANKNNAIDDIDCYIQIENYRRKPSPSLALSIYDRYIKSGKVQLSGAAKQSVGRQIEQFRRLKARHRKKYRMRQAISSLFGKKTRSKQKSNPDLFLQVSRDVQMNLNTAYNKFLYSKECKMALSKANSLLVSLHENDIV